MFWITAESLHDISLVHVGGELQSASVFPMFDASGRVDAVLVFSSYSANIWYFDPREMRLQYRWFRPMGVAGELQELTEKQLPRISQLWHFDPWWLLKASRYQQNLLSDAIKQTNCVGMFNRQIETVIFRRNLKTALYTQFKSKENGHQLQKFKSSFQPVRKKVTGSSQSCNSVMPERSRWVLDPFWSSR